MKVAIKISLKYIKVASALLLLLATTQIMPMYRASSLQTPEQRRALAAKQAVYQKLQQQKQKELAAQAAAILPPDIQRYEIATRILPPVIAYLKQEIAKKNTFYPVSLEGHPAKITNAEFSKNGKILVTSSEGSNQNLIIWDVETMRKLRTISVPIPAERNIEIVVPSPDGSKVIASIDITTQSKDNPELEITESTLILCDTATGNLIKMLELPHKYVNEIEFSSDSKRIIVTGAPEKTITDPNAPESQAYIYIADAATGNTITTHEIINNYANITLNPNGSTMVVRSDTDLILYDLATGKEIKKLEGPTHKIYNANYSADGRKIIGDDVFEGIVFIWGGETGRLLKQFNNLFSNGVALNSNATKMLTTDAMNQTISLWDVATQAITRTITTSENIFFVKFSPDDTMIAATMDNEKVTIWNAGTSEELIATSGNDVIFSADSKRVEIHKSPAENEEKCTMVIWDLSKKQEIHTFVAKHDLFNETSDLLNAISPDANDHNFILWTSFSPEERATLQKVEKGLDITHVQFLNELYKAKLNNTPISIFDNPSFKTLPVDVQNMITLYLQPTSTLQKTGLIQKPVPFEQSAVTIQQPLPQQKPQPQGLWQRITSGWW